MAPVFVEVVIPGAINGELEKQIEKQDDEID